jgi:hypothetical protein
MPVVYHTVTFQRNKSTLQINTQFLYAKHGFCFSSLIIAKRRGRAGCGAGKTFLEFPAGGDQREKQ